jgi:hypothetical protein
MRLAISNSPSQMSLAAAFHWINAAGRNQPAVAR